MNAAQKLYESIGFIHIDGITRNGRDFKVYEKSLTYADFANVPLDFK